MDARHLLLVPALALATVTLAAPAAADVPTCFGKPATLVGTAGNDVLKGSGGDDVIWAGPGWDVVWGYEGNDLICLADPTDPAPDPDYGSEEGENDERYGYEFAHGGGGDDQLVGGRGTSEVRGGYGDDVLWAIGDPDYVSEFSTGADYYQGGPGDDVLHGGPAGEYMRGGRGADRIEVGADDADANFAYGGPGPDTLVGSAAVDNLNGGKGDDHLDGAGGNDWLFGDHKHHGTLDGWTGDDVLVGGTGDDRIWGMGGTNTTDAGPGDDECLDPTPAQGAADCERTADLPEQYPPRAGR